MVTFTKPSKLTKTLRLALATVISGALMLGAGIGTASAATVAPAAPVSVEKVNIDQLNALTKTYKVVEGKVALDYKVAAATITDANVLEDYISGFISVGGDVANLPGNIHAQQFSAVQTDALMMIAGCVGRNRAWNDFWGWHLEIDSCKASDIVTQAGLGAAGVGAITLILAAIPGVDIGSTPLGTVVGSILGVGASVLAACNTHDGQPTGLTIHFTSGWTVVPWCGYQT